LHFYLSSLFAVEPQYIETALVV